jgi:hypothetical protein
MKHNLAFEADAVRQHIVSCCISAPRGSTQLHGLPQVQPPFLFELRIETAALHSACV